MPNIDAGVPLAGTLGWYLWLKPCHLHMSVPQGQNQQIRLVHWLLVSGRTSAKGTLGAGQRLIWVTNVDNAPRTRCAGSKSLGRYDLSFG